MFGKYAALALVCICSIGPAACDGGSGASRRLGDGMTATPPPVSLQGVKGRVVETRVRVVADVRRSRDPTVRACLRQGSPNDGHGPGVLRFAVAGRSITFSALEGRAVVACDGTARRGAWCGRAYGRLRQGHLPDPRLDLACASTGGRTLAFAWIDPSPRARYVVVRHRSYAESYRIAARLPVRIVGSDVGMTGSSAAFDVSEHAADGRLVQKYRLRARVAG